jgi:LAO/AO transport system kinase
MKGPVNPSIKVKHRAEGGNGPVKSSVNELFSGLQRGDKKSASRLMTMIENEDEAAEYILKQLYASDSRALVIGITGWPGVGKSTLISRVAKAFLDEGRKVGIIAVDPTSPFSGGGLLGDRIRFRGIDGHARLFIRSAASRGHHGGLSRSARAFVKVMEVMGLDVVLLETVGIGQDQIGVSLVADTTVVVLAPGLGDYLQAIKSGVLETGDIYVVNKADRPDADKAVQYLEALIQMQEKVDWRPKVIRTTAADGGGIGDLMTEISLHDDFCRADMKVQARKAGAARNEIREAIKTRLLERFLEQNPSASESIGHFARGICGRHTDPYLVADLILAEKETRTSNP